MKEKFLSLALWVVIWVAGTVWYNHFTQPSSPPSWWFGWQSMEMTDERLTQMAERLGITKDELQKELDSWKDIRTLMQEKWISWGNRGQSTQQSGQSQ